MLELTKKGCDGYELLFDANPYLVSRLYLALPQYPAETLVD